MKTHRLPGAHGQNVCSAVWLHDLEDLNNRPVKQIKKELRRAVEISGTNRAIILAYKWTRFSRVLHGLRFRLWGLRSKKLFNTRGGVCYVVYL